MKSLINDQFKILSLKIDPVVREFDDVMSEIEDFEATLCLFFNDLGLNNLYLNSKLIQFHIFTFSKRKFIFQGFSSVG
jgi:hypothetical protein